MDREMLWRQFSALPSTARREVLDFMAFLASRASLPKPGESVPFDDLSNEPVIGIWRDRADMSDPEAWLRGMRREEGEPPGG